MKSPAYQFLTACLRDNGTAISTLMNRDSQDWEGVVRVAMEESLLPLLHTRVNQLQLGPTVPPDVVDFLAAVEDLNRERNSAILNEVKFAARLLNEVGIEPILLKGVAYLALGVYPSSATRYLRDVDLLLSETQFETAVDLLVRNGFEPDNSDQFGQFRHHHPPMRRLGSVFLEIHHCLCLGKCGSLLPANQLIARSVPCDLNGVRARVPCPEDLFTHLVMHSQIQHPYNERIWPPLRAMCDLDCVLHRFRNIIDWGSVERRFRAAGQFGLLVLHLSQVNEALGTSAPFQVRMNGLTRLRWLRRKLLRRMPALRYTDPIYMFSTVLIRRLRVLGSMFRKPNGLRHLVRQLLTAGVYRRFATDVVEGRGR
jgi:putative nucleotidyltransferase-like protein